MSPFSWPVGAGQQFASIIFGSARAACERVMSRQPALPRVKSDGYLACRSNERNPSRRFVGRYLNDAGFGTLLFDLLTPEEEAVDAHSVADVATLTALVRNAQEHHEP